MHRRTLYHTTLTDRVEGILQEGFRDTSYRTPPGVHLCDQPDQHFTANGRTAETVLAVSLPAEEVNDAHLDAVQMPDCRDYIIPADVIRAVGTVSVHMSLPGVAK